MDYVIGVDPGKTGGYAIVGKDNTLLDVVPFKKDITQCRNIFGHRYMADYEVFIEKVTASPQMGVVSAFTFGRWAEVVETAARLTGVPVTMVRPQVWQSAIGCFSKGDKNKLYDFAKNLYPEEYKRKMFNKSTADAVLIAHYGWQAVTIRQCQEDGSDS